MGSFSKTLQQTKTEPEIDLPAADQPAHKPPALWEDPRPDLQDDHRLWQRFLKLASNLPDEKEAFKLVGILNGIRAGGTQLVKGNNGFVVRPILDSTTGWASQEEYEYMRDKYMKPHIDSIKVLLQVLKQESWYG
ncbi:hypothetical protein SD939_10440 [Lactobacillus crispatus]|uniref:hypothetical protein n=1 Tax=Lactobacillus crispatus TaxID=47770 RepID=UPI0029C3A099|nr:hypothetical protein [Lactobacillus crispatus]MDX5091624.1 hypothetical protein [Lactobacillus crispatus]